MQLILELILVKKKKKDTLIDLLLYFSVIAAISLTVLNVANIVGIKWLAILAAIDLIYYTCTKLCLMIFAFIALIGTVGIKRTYRIFFKYQYGIDDIKKTLK